MIKSDRFYFLLGISLNITANTLFAIYVCPFYAKNTLGIIGIVLVGSIALTSMYLQIRTHLLDPGYIKKNTDPDPSLEYQQNSPTTTFDTSTGYRSTIDSNSNSPKNSTEIAVEINTNNVPLEIQSVHSIENNQKKLVTVKDQNDSSSVVNLDKVEEGSTNVDSGKVSLDPECQIEKLNAQLPNTYPFLPPQAPPVSYQPYPHIYVKSITVNNSIVETKYCSTCKCWRPPRAAHCTDCDRCVETHDHHCPWMGNCIGERNYRQFYLFLVSSAINAVLLTAGSGVYLASFGPMVLEQPLVLTLCILSGVFSWTLTGMSLYHTYLVSRGITTREDIKRIYNVPQENPFYQGSIWNNFKYVFCKKQTKSK